MVRDPAQSPVSLLLDDWHSLDSIEQKVAAFRLANVRVNKKRVGFGVDVFHHDLEAIEATCLSGLDFGTEPLDQILVDNTI